MICKNEKLQSVIYALNAANVDRYNEVKIQYPGFTWDPPLIDISKLVTLVQRVYPAQVVEYTLGHGTKSMTMIEDHTNHRTRMVMTTDPNQDHQKTYTEKDTDMMPQIEEIGMIAIQAGQIVVIIIS